MNTCFFSLEQRNVAVLERWPMVEVLTAYVFCRPFKMLRKVFFLCPLNV